MPAAVAKDPIGGLLGSGEESGVVEDDAHDEHHDAPADAAEHPLGAVLILEGRRLWKLAANLYLTYKGELLIANWKLGNICQNWKVVQFAVIFEEKVGDNKCEIPNGSSNILD